jgi:hypothetical protein
VHFAGCGWALASVMYRAGCAFTIIIEKHFTGRRSSAAPVVLQAGGPTERRHSSKLSEYRRSRGLLYGSGIEKNAKGNERSLFFRVQVFHTSHLGSVDVVRCKRKTNPRHKRSSWLLSTQCRELKESGVRSEPTTWTLFSPDCRAVSGAATEATIHVPAYTRAANRN